MTRVNMNESVETICYGHKESWKTRREAIANFFEGMLCSEGAERDRYTNIYLALMSGDRLAMDEEVGA